MAPFFYYLFILPVSKLPMGVLYRFSDLLFLFAFYGIGYRKKLIYSNISRAFPDRSNEDRRAISKEFYRHLCDLVFESFKGFSISESELRYRFRFANPEVLDDDFHKGQSVILVGGHYGNWEYLAMGLGLWMKHRMAGIYKPLSNRFFEEKMAASRTRFRLELIAIKETAEYFRRESLLVKDGKKIPFFVCFGMDQSPGDPRKAHWMKFLGIDTGVVFGAEKFAKEYQLPVYFGCIKKVKRGQYVFTAEKVAEPPHTMPHGWIIEQGTKLLEKEILKYPAHWLWSHRRWKHAKPV